MNRPDFKNIPFDPSILAKATTSTSNQSWETPEQITIKEIYTPEDTKDLHHLNFVAGLPPFLRGPYSSMYSGRPWTIRQYAGSS